MSIYSSFIFVLKIKLVFFFNRDILALKFETFYKKILQNTTNHHISA